MPGRLTQGRESYKSDQLGARSVMLRIPLPEYDGFALACLQLTANSQPSTANIQQRTAGE